MSKLNDFQKRKLNDFRYGDNDNFQCKANEESVFSESFSDVSYTIENQQFSRNRMSENDAKFDTDILTILVHSICVFNDQEEPMASQHMLAGEP